MVAQQIGLHEQSSTIDDHHQFQDPYYEEDTLSLCDLPLTSNSDSSWDDEYLSSKDEHNSSFGGDDQGFFEFFSEDFTASTYPAPADKIVFCGKIIGSKQEEGGGGGGGKTGIGRESQRQEFMNSKMGSNLSFHKLRTTSSRHQHQVRSSTHKSLSSQASLNKVSTRSSSSKLVKSKWYVFAFGMGRYSIEMEQRDIKKRQSRRAPPLLPVTTTMFRMVEKGGLFEGNRKRSGKGLWGLLRLLGCKKN